MMKQPLLAYVLLLLSMIELTSMRVQSNARQSTATATKLPQLSGGLNGYISFSLPRPPDATRAGVSFYAGIWPLLEKPLEGFQIGLPSTWIIPDNADFDKPLCPPGTIARDNWPERGPVYRGCIPGDRRRPRLLGKHPGFGSATPKISHEWNAGWLQSRDLVAGVGVRPAETLCRMSTWNRAAKQPAAPYLPLMELTFKTMTGTANCWAKTHGMALPISRAHTLTGSVAGSTTPTGEQCWTLFLNAANFKGPIAYWTPETWKQSYPKLSYYKRSRPGCASGTDEWRRNGVQHRALF